ncbi:hypothetical protein ScPMuIL_001615 [Solemya velum]
MKCIVKLSFTTVTVCCLLVGVAGHYIDLAQEYRLHVSQSYTQVSDDRSYTTNAGNAVDGNTDQTVAHGHCSRTDYNNLAWWGIRFKEKVNIDRIIIYHRNEQKSLEGFIGSGIYMEDASIACRGKLVYTHTSNPIATWPYQDVFNISVNASGNFLTVCRRNGYVQLCEVLIMECEVGRYGSNCASLCGNCEGGNQTCNHTDGACPQGCTHPFIGYLCLATAPETSDQSGDDTSTFIGIGLGVGLAACFLGSLVTGLVCFRMRKKRSRNKSPKECVPMVGSKLDTVDGDRPDTVDGDKPDSVVRGSPDTNTYLDLDVDRRDDNVDLAQGYRLDVSQSSTHVPSNKVYTGDAENAVDGNTDQTMAHGHCSHTDYNNPAWWRIQFTEKVHIDRIIIYHRNEFGNVLRRFNNSKVYITDDRSACSGDLVYTQTNDPTDPWQDVFNISVYASGEYLSVCRRNGYVQLCEVLIMGCPYDKYGNQCNLTCGHCDQGTCSLSGGTCPGRCGYQYMGPKCDKPCSVCKSSNCYKDGCRYGCVAGKHGDYCDLPCPTNCKDGTCDQSTGHCGGCTVGHWGDDCQQTCSVNCNSTSCGKTDGQCNECEAGRYGPNCASVCGNCEGGNQTCHHTDGACPQGCTRPFIGYLCIATAPETSDESGDDTSTSIGIGLGVGLAACFLGSLVTGLVCYRMRKRRYGQQSTTGSVDMVGGQPDTVIRGSPDTVVGDRPDTVVSGRPDTVVGGRSDTNTYMDLTVDRRGDNVYDELQNTSDGDKSEYYNMSLGPVQGDTGNV